MSWWWLLAPGAPLAALLLVWIGGGMAVGRAAVEWWR